MAKNNEARFTADIQDFESKLTKMTNSLNKFAKGGTTSLSGLAGAVGKLAGSFGLAISAVSVLQDAMGKSIGFEKSLSSLQSLTGMGASEMGFFKDAAIEMGSTSTQTASQVVDAFKLIGSQKPELLKDRDALKEVTKAAITLAEAAGMEVPDAAKALTGVLNQFGMDASKSSDVINMLAAASQQGAGDINYLNDAVVKAGSVAKSFNVPINEVIAGLEQLAQAGIDSSTAGTGLRNVMLALAKTGDADLDPAVHGLIGAMTNLQGKGLSAVQMMQMFGKENIATAQVLMESASKANEMAEAITGTNTAEEQAKINNDNLAGALKSLDSAWEGLVLSLNNSNGALKGIVDWLTDCVTWAQRTFTELGAIQGKMEEINRLKGDGNGNSRAQMDKNRINNATNADDARSRMNAARSSYDRDINEAQSRLKKVQHDIEMMVNAGAGNAVFQLRGQLSDIKAEISALERMRDEVVSSGKAKIESFSNAANNATNGGGGGGGKPDGKIPFDEGSIGALQEQLKAANDALIRAATDEARAAAAGIVAELEEKINGMKAASQGSGISTFGVGQATSTGTANDLLKSAAGNMDLSGVNNALKDHNDKVAQAVDKYKEMQSVTSSLQSIMSTLGNSMDGSAAQFVSSISSMIGAIAKLIPALRAMSIAEGTEKATKTSSHWIETLSAIAAVTASVIGTFSSLPKFAHGAIATGPTYGLFGENGPEAVIPLDRLSEMIGGNGNGQMKGKVDFRIKNQELVGTYQAATTLINSRR